MRLEFELPIRIYITYTSFHINVFNSGRAIVIQKSRFCMGKYTSFSASDSLTHIRIPEILFIAGKPQESEEFARADVPWAAILTVCELLVYIISDAIILIIVLRIVKSCVADLIIM